MWQGIFLPELIFSSDSYGVHTAQCAITHINIHMHVKIPNAGSHIPLFRHAEILHTLVEVGSAALAAAAPLPG